MFRTMESHSLSYQDKTFIFAATYILCYLTITEIFPDPTNLVKGNKTDEVLKGIVFQINSVFKHEF